MSRIFSPFSALMLKLKYPQKFIVFSILFIVPLGMLLNIWLNELQKNIHSTELEKTGTAYIREIMPFMLSIQQHRGLMNGYLNGDQSSESSLMKISKEIEAEITRLMELQAGQGARLELEDSWNAIVSEWNTLEERAASMTAPESFAQHTELIDNLIHHIVEAADRSSLTLDPEIETYYLMDAMVNQIPMLIEQTGQVRGQINGALARRSLSTDERIQTMLQQEQIKSAYYGMNKGLERATSANESLKASIGVVGEQSIHSINGFLQTLDEQILNAETLQMNPQDFFNIGTETIDHAYAFFTSINSELDRLLSERRSEDQFYRNQMLAIVGASILLVALFFGGFYFSVKQTIRHLQSGADKLASGQLSERIQLQTRDELREIGTSFNAMADSLSTLVLRSQEISQHVAASSQQLSAVSVESTSSAQQVAFAIQGIAEGAESQNQTSEDNTLAMNEIASGIQNISESAAEAAEEAAIISDHAVQSGEKLNDTVQQMNNIQSSVHESTGIIAKLGEQSTDIGQIVDTIHHISEQTHMLALNANIEAARAGEHGRSFKVVATEVAKLAAQSKQSAEHITEIIEQIHSLVGQVEESMTGTVRETEQGMRVISETSESVGSIIRSIQNIAQRVLEISASSQEVSAGAEEVSAAISETSHISKSAADQASEVAAATEQQLASMEEVQASSEALSSYAQQLQDELSRFTIPKPSESNS
ncbi:methyl-accepting chemotaxis protein [Marinicrinis lubricantis]|uniref:Methyl-accepting chemotaxis protein n=1 Tax=Marinicrinis lubricantis TaxID=2086470 RepID=A0ABW1IP57_9BACL